MIDIHPPQHSSMTARDFFIHLGIVVLGILIAIGLEQTVEYIHHRQQLADIRAQLVQERDLNRKILEHNQFYVDRMQAELAHDIVVLHQRSVSPSAPLDDLHYTWYFLRPLDGVWISARQNGSLSLMPDRELHLNAYRYEAIDSLLDQMHQFQSAIELAGAIVSRAKPQDLSAQDVHDLVVATSDAQGKISLVQKFMLICKTRALSDKIDFTYLDRPVRDAPTVIPSP